MILVIKLQHFTLNSIFHSSVSFINVADFWSLFLNVCTDLTDLRSACSLFTRMGPRSLNAPSAHLHLILGTVKQYEALTVNPFINTLQAMISSLLLLFWIESGRINFLVFFYLLLLM